MKSLVLVVFLIGLVACSGDNGTNGSDGANGESCVVTDLGDQVLIECPGQDGVYVENGNNYYDNAKEIYSKYRRSVFRLTVTCSDNTVSFGTGFLCETNKVCTNGHVVNCDNYTVRNIKMEIPYSSLDTVEYTKFKDINYPTIYGSGSNYVDLAKIYIPSYTEDLEVLPINQDSYPDTDTLTHTLSMGYPLGFEDLYTDLGHINNDYLGECYGGSGYGCPSTYYDFSTTNDTDHGSSGSPVFNVLTGEVIGVVTAGTEGENINLSWCIDASELNDF